MTEAEFRNSLSNAKPPTGLSIPLKGLWHAGKGDWHKAHAIVQDDPSPESAWVHAHLHKQEGDISNAHYWYARSLRNTSTLTLDEEWSEIVRALLAGERSKNTPK